MKLKLIIILIQFTMLNLIQAQSKSTIILVHGAGHGSWCWTKVIPLLKEKGINTVAIDLPGHSNDTTKLFSHQFMDDAIAIKNLASAIDGKVILVGHSSGGVAIAQASELLGTDKVQKLIFLDAFMPFNGQSVRELAAQAYKNSNAPSNDNSNPTMLFTSNYKAFQWNPNIVEDHFYHDCSKEDKGFAKHNLTWQSAASIGTPAQLSDTVYGRISKYYILCTKAKDLDKSSISNNVPIKKLYKLPSSHSPFLSMPQKLTNIFVKIHKDK